MTADPFDDLAHMFLADNALYGAVNQAEQQMWAEDPTRGISDVEVMRRAWDALTPEQQATAMDHLFTAYRHHTRDAQEAVEMAARAREAGDSFLEHDDLEVITYSLSFADYAEIDETGDIRVPLDVLSRLVQEIKLLRARLELTGGVA